MLRPLTNFNHRIEEVNNKLINELNTSNQYTYLYINRGNNYPQYKDNVIVLSESYKNYRFICIEILNTRTGVFRELAFHTSEFYQSSDINPYYYYFDEFIIKPSMDGTQLIIHNDIFPQIKINVITGYNKR